MIGWRSATLHHTMHCTVTQLIKEGNIWTFTVLLAHCIYAGKVLTIISDTTPYTTRFGTTPATIPYLDTTQKDGLQGDSRDPQRIRIVTLQEQKEATAIAKIKPALDPKTSGQQLYYAQGELVDHYTEPSQKEISVRKH